MSKRNVWIKVISLAASAFMGVPGLTGIALAQSLESQPEVNSKIDAKEFRVSNTWELIACVNKAHNGDTIILENDMVLDSKLNITSSICLNLNDHTISVKGDKAGIVVGCSKFERSEQHFKHIRGHYEVRPRAKPILLSARSARVKRKKMYIPAFWKTVITTERIWIPDVYKPYLKPIYTYDDSIDVLIKNGKIKKLPGDNGRDGEKGSNRCNGESGKTPAAPVEILSGTLRLSKIKIKGGQGGNGGNGGYEKLVHIIFGSGDGGNGGNGAKGGYAVYICRKGCKLIKGEGTELEAGNPGNGGRGGEPNPNYWVYSGNAGSDGKDGPESYSYNM